MKLTWFGGTTIRIHIGGAILVVDPAGAPAGIDAAELISGADQVIEAFGSLCKPVDSIGWRPRRAPRVVEDDGALAAVETWLLGQGALVIDAIGEPPLLLLDNAAPELGRWAEDAVVVLFGDRLAELAASLLDNRPPRLIALTGDDAAIDNAVPQLRDRLDGTGLVALEAGLALEV